MFKPLFYAICGGAGFALSFIVGIFSGASFVLVLIRALVFGVAFAALSFLFHFILGRFVPDLFGESPEPASGAASSASNLDITIDGEDDSFLDEDSDIPDFMKSAVTSGSAIRSEAGESAAISEDAENAAISEGGESAVEADGQEESPKDVASDAENSAEDEAFQEEGGESAAKADGQGESPEDVVPAAENSAEDGEERDELPDAHDFAPADFEGESDEPASDDDAAPPVSRRQSNFTAREADVEVMANAIRTVLSKKQ